MKMLEIGIMPGKVLIEAFKFMVITIFARILSVICDEIAHQMMPVSRLCGSYDKVRFM